MNWTVLWLQKMPQRLLDYAFQIFDLKMRATAFKLFWEVANSRQACVEQLKMAIGSPKKKRCDQSEYKERASWYSAEYKIATENIVPESYEINSCSKTNCKRGNQGVQGWIQKGTFSTLISLVCHVISLFRWGIGCGKGGLERVVPIHISLKKKLRMKWGVQSQTRPILKLKLCFQSILTLKLSRPLRRPWLFLQNTSQFSQPRWTPFLTRSIISQYRGRRQQLQLQHGGLHQLNWRVVQAAWQNAMGDLPYRVHYVFWDVFQN